jgi:hypothetical protein
MCHDLLNMEGNKYVYEMTTHKGRKEMKSRKNANRRKVAWVDGRQRIIPSQIHL